MDDLVHTIRGARLQMLDSYGCRTGQPDELFQDIAELAAYVCGTPMAFVAFDDLHQCRITGRHGVDWDFLPFSMFPVFSDEPSDLSRIELDASVRIRQNASLPDHPEINFVAAAPILTPLGQYVGALVSAHTQEHELAHPQIRLLEELRSQAVCVLELRRMTKEVLKQRGP